MFLGLYILNGIIVSPRIQYKFRPQHQDPVNGSDLCHNAFGPNARWCHHLFKNLFAVQDPVISVRPRNISPNHKIDPFLEHLACISLETYDPGANLSGDEQVASFQGRYQDKQRVTYKRAGDGFLFDSIGEDGFSIAFFARNVPAHDKWTS